MTPQEIVSFWEQAGEASWFVKDAAFDGALRVRFGDALREARDGAYDHWGETPEGALGLVLLLDQVSRNIHRGSPLAFAADSRALRLAKDWIGKGYHQKLVPPRARWLIMPFEHAEDIDAQRRGVALFQTMGLTEMAYWAQGPPRHHREVRALPASQSGSRPALHAARTGLPEVRRFCGVVSDSVLSRSFHLTPVEFRSLLCRQFGFRPQRDISHENTCTRGRHWRWRGGRRHALSSGQEGLERCGAASSARN